MEYKCKVCPNKIECDKKMLEDMEAKRDTKNNSLCMDTDTEKKAN